MDMKGAMPMQKEFSLERIRQLVADLEQELSAAPPDSPKVAELRAELDLLKDTLAGPDRSSSALEQQLHGVRGKLDDVVASVEGEVLKDTPYLAELGRILGLV
jgi:hypothetical protein